MEATRHMPFLRGFSFFLFYVVPLFIYHLCFEHLLYTKHCSRCRRLDSEQENQILEALALSGAPLFRFGNERKDTPPHICPLPDRASLSTDAFAAPPSISPVTQSLSHESVFGSLPLVYLPLSPRSLSVHLPEGFVPSFMPSMHGDIFPHLSHRVLSARVFFLSPTFIREQKPFSLLLRQTFFFLWVLLSYSLSSLHRLVLICFFSHVLCICKYSLRLNLLFYFWGGSLSLANSLSPGIFSPFCLPLKLSHLILAP